MTRAYALAQALAHTGYDVEISGLKLTAGPLYPVPPSSVNVKQINSHSRLFGLLRLAFALDGDIVYAIKPRLSSYGVALLKRRLSGTPVVLDIDDWEMAEMAPHIRPPGKKASRPRSPRSFGTRVAGRARRMLRNGLRWLDPADVRYLRWLDKTICSADAITVNTRLLHIRYGGTYVPQCKDTGIYDPDKYDPESSRRRYGLSDYIVLMFPGTARPHKGLEDILTAMDALQNRNARLVIVGGRSCCESYVAQLMQRWSHWIVRLPSFPQEQMPEIVAAAHVIVVPQRDTGIARAQFPMKLTDGMAMAKPILATSVGDIPEILGSCGYLVAPSSPEQLTRVLKRILEQPQAATTRGNQARERFLRCYSLGAVGPVLSGVFETLR
ncbi:MAG: glycosyltransferase [Thiogranum sp.]|nr:glycosyltransferase [Thiogranum sp.]